MTELAAKAKMKQTRAKLNDLMGYFRDTPSATNFNNLEAAMLEHQSAYQHVLDARELNAFYNVTAEQEAGLAQ